MVVYFRLLCGMMLITTLGQPPVCCAFGEGLQSAESTRFTVCESIDHSCSQPGARPETTWTFNGTEGTATVADSTNISRLTIESLDRTTLVVRRTTPDGLTVVYSGVIQGSVINGTMQSTWPGHPGYPKAGFFVAQSKDFHDAPVASASAAASPGAAAAQGLPPELLVCENGLCNAAWSLRDSDGVGTYFFHKPLRVELSVIRSDPDDILIRRAPDARGISATYAGSLRTGHYSGTVIYSSPGHAGDSSGTWTAMVPVTQCDPKSGLDAATAMQIGQTALMFHRDGNALQCYIVAAEAGDATAQTEVGLTYYQGRPSVPQDYSQALFWLRKAADQGVYSAQRTVAEMYLAGQGTSPNTVLAAIYDRRANAQMHEVERRQQMYEREADRRTQVLSSFVLGASFGLFF